MIFLIKVSVEKRNYDMWQNIHIYGYVLDFPWQWQLKRCCSRVIQMCGPLGTYQCSCKGLGFSSLRLDSSSVLLTRGGFVAPPARSWTGGPWLPLQLSVLTAFAFILHTVAVEWNGWGLACTFFALSLSRLVPMVRINFGGALSDVCLKFLLKYCKCDHENHRDLPADKSQNQSCEKSFVKFLGLFFSVCLHFSTPEI